MKNCKAHLKSGSKMDVVQQATTERTNVQYNLLMIYYCFNGTVPLANHHRPPEKPERVFG